MSKLIDLNWNLFLLKNRLLSRYGYSHGLIKTYYDEPDLIERLRDVCYGGIPASVIILAVDCCVGRCCDRALLLSHAFKDFDFRMVSANIDGILLRPDNKRLYVKCKNDGISVNENYGLHRFLEVKKDDGSEWVYDTSTGLIYDKKLYYQMQSPKVIKIDSKENVFDYIEFREVEESTFEAEKKSLPLLMPLIEINAEYENRFYRDYLKSEIELTKNRFDYDSLCKAKRKEMVNRGIIV